MMIELHLNEYLFALHAAYCTRRKLFEGSAIIPYDQVYIVLRKKNYQESTKM